MGFPVPQISTEARVAVPMQERAFDGFNEIPKNPLNSSNQGNTEFVQLRELVVEKDKSLPNLRDIDNDLLPIYT